VLPDPLNLGYQDFRFMTIDQVNQHKISNLRDLTEAIRHPTNGFHQIQFMPSDTVHQLILDADETAKADRRIMQRYGLEKDRVINTQ
jgi:hypothetical protein